MTRFSSTLCALTLCAAALTACSPSPSPEQTAVQPPVAAAVAEPAPPLMTAPAGSYVLDKAHASLLFRVDHIGFSRYTARFRHFDAQLEFDPEELARSSVTATVDATSIETDYPDPAQLDFNAMLRGEQWLDTARFPQMTFRSKTIAVTAPNSMRIEGDLTLRGVTLPVVLDATYNGGYDGHPLDPRARIGFSAHGTLSRSAFGMSYGVPAPGTRMGVGDEVEIIIEAEFSGPALASADAG